MDEDLQCLTIGAVAGAASVGVETIRFYQRKGLLDEPDRPQGGIRRYGQRDVARVRFIKSAQRLGFSLHEVAELLALEDGTHCDEARALAEFKLAAVREKLDGLRRIETALRAMIGACRHAEGSVCCPVIEALQATKTDRGVGPAGTNAPENSGMRRR